jgi:hypothetical protein
MPYPLICGMKSMKTVNPESVICGLNLNSRWKILRIVYFARVLAQAPDQLISNNHPSLFLAPEEPPLPIDPELLRIVSPASSNDLAGLNAMQPMVKSKDSDVHYILPLPPGLHANSDEMFGFFTYEFRVGHFERPPATEGAAGKKVWTTAQGRFGRRLKMQGIQHPAPALSCMPNRDKDKVWVTAPYAVAVHKGKNVTANPPRTGIVGLAVCAGETGGQSGLPKYTIG